MRLFLLLAALSLSFTAQADAPTTKKCYETDSKVSLTGKVKTISFKNARGDSVRAEVLVLDEPICFMSEETGAVQTTEVQLAGPRKLQKPVAGKRGTFTGSLFGAHTGWHRRDVLLDID